MRPTTLETQMFHDHFHRTGWAHPWLGLLFLVLIGVAVGFAIWALFRATRPAHPAIASGYPGAAAADPAVDTLRMRFARGEIDASEYAARVAHLSGAVPPPAAPSPPPEPNA